MNPKRYVVVDLNALTKGLHEFVNPNDQIVLTQLIVCEIAESVDFEKHATSFPKWLKQRSQQIYIAHELGGLVGLERSYKDQIVGLAWCDERSTHLLRKVVQDSSVNLQQRMIEFKNSGICKDIDKSKQWFIKYCQQFSNYLKDKDPDAVQKLVHDFDREATESIRQPKLGWVLPKEIDRYNDTLPTYRKLGWRKALERFPDEKAIGRWSRLIWWYAMAHAAGQTRKFANNFEDSMYALTASYTGYIATDDKRLHAAIRAIFPQTTILSSNSSH